MKNVIIRTAVYTDIPQLVSLRILFLCEKYGVCTVKNNSNLQRQVEMYFQMNINNANEIVVAEIDEDIIGVFCVSYLQLLPSMNPDTEKSAYLMFEFIKPEFRMEKIREKLFEYSIKCAKKKNATVYEEEVFATEFLRYEKKGFIKSPFPLLRLLLSKKNKQNHMKIGDVNITFRKAEMGDISELIEFRVKFLAEVLGKQEILIREALSERLKVYLEDHLNDWLEVFVAEDEKKVVGVIFLIYYKKIPEIGISNGKVGLPVNFFIQPCYRKTNLSRTLFDFSVQSAFEQEVKLFEMTIPKESIHFFDKLGFEQMKEVPIQIILT
ncbi:MAG: GNAT family N-acetyltransferase [Lachnospiraceae bacterium]|nr:GNAT family N-acetyltransferase [Lachnospiraceae bacterium]